MTQFPFKINKEIYYLKLLEDYENTMKSNKTLNNIYQPCFQNTTDINNIKSFTKNKGCTILITDKLDNFIFICTFVKNIYTKHIEIYNVCKNLKEKNIRANIIIKYLIKYFIKNNKIFKGYSQIDLAILLDNEFIVPTIMCYQKIGFRYSGDKNLLATLPSKFTMNLDLFSDIKLTKTDKTSDFILIIYNHFNYYPKLLWIYKKIIPNAKNNNNILQKIKLYLSKYYE